MRQASIRKSVSSWLKTPLQARQFGNTPLVAAYIPARHKTFNLSKHLEGKAPFGDSGLGTGPAPKSTSITIKPAPPKVSLEASSRSRNDTTPPRQDIGPDCTVRRFHLETGSVQPAQYKYSLEAATSVQEQIKSLTQDGGRWNLLNDEPALERYFRFPRFIETWKFMTAVADYAKASKHHPEWSNCYTEVFIRLTSHDKKAITLRDTAMAAKCDEFALRLGASPEVQVDQKKLAGLAAKIAMNRNHGRITTKEKLLKDQQLDDQGLRTSLAAMLTSELMHTSTTAPVPEPLNNDQRLKEASSDEVIPTPTVTKEGAKSQADHSSEKEGEPNPLIPNQELEEKEKKPPL